MFEGLSAQLQDSLLNLLSALGVLVGGWLLALLLAALVRAVLRRTGVDNRLAAWVQGDDTTPATDTPRVESVVSRIVFWLVMLVVLVAVFDILDLTETVGPLQVFLNEIAEYAPRLLSVAALVVIAWVLATVLRLVIRAALKTVRLDERLEAETAPAPDAPDYAARPRLSLSNTIANTVYWLVFLFFLPAILEALNLQGLLEPVQSLLEDILGFLPRLVAAGLILLVGWFVARVLQRIITNLLYAAGVDYLGDEVGLATVLGGRRLSEVLGFVVYVLVLIPVLIGALNALEMEAITVPASNMLNDILEAIPDIFAAGLLLLLAYIGGRLVAGLVTNLLGGIGFDSIMMQLGLGPGRLRPAPAAPSTPAPPATDDDAAFSPPPAPTIAIQRRPSEVVGYVVLVAIMLFAIIEALHILQFEALAALVIEFTQFAGRVLLGLLIFGIGLYIANLVAGVIWASAGKNAGLLALIARISILVLAGAIGLRQMGLAPEIIQIGFALLVGAVAVAAALAFGLGSRDTAGRLVQDWVQDIEAGTDTTPFPGGD